VLFVPNWSSKGRNAVGRNTQCAVGIWVLASIVTVVPSLFAVQQAQAAPKPKTTTVNIPGEDRFAPFAVTVKVGDKVQWVNGDTDDHTVVADDAFDTAGHDDVNHLILGTASKGGPGQFSLTFNHPGTFVYYCRFHAHLDADHQPVAPGPKGGIADVNGNFGTPMMGIVTVRG
jgi:plastocyanin